MRKFLFSSCARDAVIARERADLSRPADQDSRPARLGQRGRYRRPPRRRQDGRAARPAALCRGDARRRRPDRHALRRPRGAGRLHRDRAERQRAHHAAEHEGGRRLRSVHRLLAGDAARRHSARPDRPPVVPGQGRRRSHPDGEGEARRHQLRLRRSRQPAAHRHGAVHARRRHPDDARAYRGVTPAVQDVVGGQVPIMLTAMSAVPPLLPTSACA